MGGSTKTVLRPGKASTAVQKAQGSSRALKAYVRRGTRREPPAPVKEMYAMLVNMAAKGVTLRQRLEDPRSGAETLAVLNRWIWVQMQKADVPAHASYDDLQGHALERIARHLDDLDPSLDPPQQLAWLTRHVAGALRDAQRQADPLTRSQRDAVRKVDEAEDQVASEGASLSRITLASRVLPRADQRTQHVAAYGTRTIDAMASLPSESAESQCIETEKARVVRHVVALSAKRNPHCPTCQDTLLALVEGREPPLDVTLHLHFLAYAPLLAN